MQEVKMMKYEKIVHGRFLKRLNRFIAEVIINDTKEQVHIKNTGRLRELLLPDVEVLLELSNNPNRKTRYSLIAVKANGEWVNIDSQAPNAVAFEALKAGKLRELGYPHLVKREVTYQDSRFDLYFEREEKKVFMEVKGVTLAKNGMAMFPDASTTRGTKHLVELSKAVQDGYEGVILFVVQRSGCHGFSPNHEMDHEFATALLDASRRGVQVLAYDAIVKEDELVLDKPLPIELYEME